MSSRFIAAFAVASTALLTSSQGFAWGNEGHEIVALIARSYLAPSVRAQVDDLLASDHDNLTAPDMASRATWADAWRQSHPETSGWHFADLELSAPSPVQACAGERSCVVRQVNRFTAQLRARSTTQDERVYALKMVLHLVGDLHQPLHAADNHDRGGNCERVSYRPAGLLGLRGLWGSEPEVTSLHGYWDTVTVQGLGRDPSAVAQTLRREITRDQVLAWSAGTPASWAAESFQIARDDTYAFGGPVRCGGVRVTKLTAEYEDMAQQIVEIQLERAGVRLATELNRALSSARLGAKRRP
jgi:hypothetical protein